MTRSADNSVPRPPRYEELPTAKPRAARGGPELHELRVRLEVVTPILGGSHQTRAIDDVDVIRAASVRGHLRFWWRALYASHCANAEELYERESALWGRAATKDGGRSIVEIRVEVTVPGGTDNSEVRLYDSRDGRRTPGAYALWPARAETRTNTPAAPRRKPGTQFQLRVKVAATSEAEVKPVRNALSAWILFGGYGGRTRRGLGSLTVIEDATAWLPSTLTREAFTSLFGIDIFAAPTTMPNDVPWFGGAALQLRPAVKDAHTAWVAALDWLKEFRQGTSGPDGERAREPDPGGGRLRRPSISNWPEADKIRHIERKTKTHTTQHSATAAWPRAGFGLPIIGQFQTTDRNDNRNAYEEPGRFELRWRAGKAEHDRLASPLIVKALALADSTFAPCALWLNRSYPQGAEVGLARPRQGGRANEKEVDPRTLAPFDRLVARDDTARFSALANKASLREAFLDWLHTNYQTTVVAP